MSDSQQKFAPMIAIIGCDGSGKSTVSEQVLLYAGKYGPAALAHLGKQAGNVGRALSNLPLIGGLFGKLISRKVASVNKSRAKNKTPGILPALVMYAFAIRRVRRFRRMLALREQGLIIITDRFPQLDFPKAFDGPELNAGVKGNFFVRWLARREHAAFEWMTSYKPDMVIRLNVDIDTAMERKPDHIREALMKKIAITPQLTFQGAPIVDIDTTQPLQDVVAEANAAVARIMTERGYQPIQV
jgi:thymidylate kinase